MTKPCWVATYYFPRGYVNPMELDPKDISIFDIQHALSNICRFNGHCREFYSVAQHCVHVSEWLARNGHDLECQLIGLLHDASEAYLGDIVRPLKQLEMYSQYLDVEIDITRKVMNKFLPPGCNWAAEEYQKAVAQADDDLLISEAIQLFNIVPEDWGKKNPTDYFHVKPISPLDARLLFEDRFHELTSALES